MFISKIIRLDELIRESSKNPYGSGPKAVMGENGEIYLSQDLSDMHLGSVAKDKFYWFRSGVLNAVQEKWEEAFLRTELKDKALYKEMFSRLLKIVL